MVYIIGTGPGDEQLLTLKAVKMLKKCTAVLYDRLCPVNILNYLNDDCEIYYCGKEPGAHYKTQEEINKSLVELAEQGHIVGRVKGGDPFVFGRGGEEIMSLIRHGIDFEVIPGVTSPVAVLSYAGIPITHRKIAQSFHVITGTAKENLNINFETLAKEEGTLVFMMGLNNITTLKNELIKNGKDPGTPAAVVMRGTTSKQRKVKGMLGEIDVLAKEAKLKSPCIIVVGPVAAFNDKFCWYEKKPLFGWNICITRAKNQSASLKEKLLNMGAEVTEINSIKIKDTSDNLLGYLKKLRDYDYIIFTSVNAVEIFFNYLLKTKYDIRKLKASIAVIGKGTKKALEKRGIIPEFEAKESTQEGLLKTLKGKLRKSDKVLIPGSYKSRPYMHEQLLKMNVDVDKVNIYDTVCGNMLNPRAIDQADVVFYTSPSTVQNMIKLVGVEKLRKKISISIGPQTEKALKENEMKCFVCSQHSEDGFLNEVSEFLEKRYQV